MRETLEWTARGDELRLDLDGSRYLAVRRSDACGEEWWLPVAVLVPGEAEREIGEGFPGREVAEDTAIKYAIQALAAMHGFSPAPGTVEDDAPEAERMVAALWRVLWGR